MAMWPRTFVVLILIVSGVLLAVVCGLGQLFGEEGALAHLAVTNAIKPPAIPRSVRRQKSFADSRLEYERDVAAIHGLRQANDLDGLVRVADELEKKWSARDAELYARLMIEVSNTIGNGFSEKRIYLLSQKYAQLALAKADSFSLELETQLLRFIEMDLTGINPSDDKDVEWRNERSSKARLWLHAWGRLEREIDRTFDVIERPRLNVRPPDETGLPAGISPTAIRDQRLREQYEAAISANAEKTRRYNYQYRLGLIEKSFARNAEDYLIKIYSKPPLNHNELKSYLECYLPNKSSRDRILRSVRGAD